MEFQEFNMNKKPIIQVFGDSDISKITDYLKPKKANVAMYFWLIHEHSGYMTCYCLDVEEKLQRCRPWQAPHLLTSIDGKNRNIIWDMYIYKYIYVELCLKIRRNYLVYELVNGPFSESTFVQLHFDCLFPNSSDPRVSISKRMITGCNKSSNS